MATPVWEAGGQSMGVGQRHLLCCLQGGFVESTANQTSWLCLVNGSSAVYLHFESKSRCTMKSDGAVLALQIKKSIGPAFCMAVPRNIS